MTGIAACHRLGIIPTQIDEFEQPQRIEPLFSLDYLLLTIASPPLYSQLAINYRGPSIGVVYYSGFIVDSVNGFFNGVLNIDPTAVVIEAAAASNNRVWIGIIGIQVSKSKAAGSHLLGIERLANFEIVQSSAESAVNLLQATLQPDTGKICLPALVDNERDYRSILGGALYDRPDADKRITAPLIESLDNPFVEINVRAGKLSFVKKIIPMVGLGI
jgi:hypothetical protein